MKLVIIILSLLLTYCSTSPKELEGSLYNLTEKGVDQIFGTITVKSLAKEGIIIHITATNLTPGNYGFHIHETNILTPSIHADGSQMIMGGMAKGHWDPDKTGIHAGPEGNGHRGDLPQLSVDDNGTINSIITNKKIQLTDIKGKSFMIHENPDNYSDTPLPLGGSGPRMFAPPF